MSLIKAEQLIKTYKKQHIETKAIRGLDLEVKQQDFISIVGPSGSGKSTLLYILSGIESFDSGDVFLFDQSISTYTEKEKSDLRSKKIGFIFQFYNLIETLTVYENQLKITALETLYTDTIKEDIYISIIDLIQTQITNDDDMLLAEKTIILDALDDMKLEFDTYQDLYTLIDTYGSAVFTYIIDTEAELYKNNYGTTTNDRSCFIRYNYTH